MDSRITETNLVPFTIWCYYLLDVDNEVQCNSKFLIDGMTAQLVRSGF